MSVSVFFLFFSRSLRPLTEDVTRNAGPRRTACTHELPPADPETLHMAGSKMASAILVGTGPTRIFLCLIKLCVRPAEMSNNYSAPRVRRHTLTVIPRCREVHPYVTTQSPFFTYPEAVQKYRSTIAFSPGLSYLAHTSCAEYAPSAAPFRQAEHHTKGVYP